MKIRVREITKEEHEQAKQKGPESLIPDSIKCGYGLYYCDTYEEDGKFYLKWEQGDSCD